MKTNRIMSLALLAALSAPPLGAEPAPSGRIAFVATTDFASGSATEIRLSVAPGLSEVNPDVAPTSGDPVAVFSGGALFVIHRGFAGAKANTIDRIDRSTFAVTKTLGTGPNPQDLERDSDTLFVSVLEDPKGMQLCSLSAGSCSGSIDVCAGQPAGPGGGCGAAEILRDGNTLYVLLGLFGSGFSVVRSGAVAVVDIPSKTRRKVLGLKTRNPSNLARLSDGKLLVTSSGSFFPNELSGGVEVVDPASGASEIVLDDDLLRGNVSDLVLLDDLAAYVTVTDPTSFVPRVVRFVPALARLGVPIWQAAYASATFFIGDIAADGAGNVLVADTVNLAAPRVVRLQGTTGLVLDSFSSGSLAPVSIATYPAP
ncbi:MAG: hypothetical protein ACREQY_15875 [Candidatus Binatia bacterium]